MEAIVNSQGLADLLGISRRRVEQLTKDGVFVRPSRGRYELGTNVRRYIAALESRVNRENDPLDDLRREKARAAKFESDLRQERFVPVEDHVFAIEALTSIFVRELETVRRRLGIRFADRKDIDQIVDTIRLDLARNFEKALTEAGYD